MRRLTGWWLVDADARKEVLRGWVIGAEEEDVGAARCRVGEEDARLGGDSDLTSDDRGGFVSP